jgi:FMN phosphatase YigB (HAD superfamily)
MLLHPFFRILSRGSKEKAGHHQHHFFSEGQQPKTNMLTTASKKSSLSIPPDLSRLSKRLSLSHRRAAVLLDFDGVVLKSKVIDRVIVDRCVDFVAKMTGCSAARARTINRNAYASAGHTALGLHALGYGNGSLQCMLDEFNEHVYDGIRPADLVRKATDEEFDAVGMIALAASCNMRDVPVFIFSNAPQQWVRGITGAFGFDLDAWNVGVLSACRSQVKPSIQAYAAAEKELSRALQTPATCVRVIFVDDKMTNVLPPVESSHALLAEWVCVHYDCVGQLVQDDLVYRTNDLCAVISLVH